MTCPKCKRQLLSTLLVPCDVAMIEGELKCLKKHHNKAIISYSGIRCEACKIGFNMTPKGKLLEKMTMHKK